MRIVRSAMVMTALAVAWAIALAWLAAPAYAHVPVFEPPGVVSSERGAVTDPFPNAVPIGSPEVSRAVYGYLSPADSADVYTFSVAAPTTVPVEILVPLGSGQEGFHPEVTIYGPDKPIGMFDRPPGKRETFYEPFSQMTLYRGPSRQVTFEPNRQYYLIVTPGMGATKSGRYVVAMGTVESFGMMDVIQAPSEIARIKAGDYGGAPADWSWTAPWIVGALVVVAAGAWLVVWLARRHRNAASDRG